MKPKQPQNWKQTKFLAEVQPNVHHPINKAWADSTKFSCRQIVVFEELRPSNCTTYTSPETEQLQKLSKLQWSQRQCLSSHVDLPKTEREDKNWSKMLKPTQTIQLCLNFWAKKEQPQKKQHDTGNSSSKLLSKTKLNHLFWWNHNQKKEIQNSINQPPKHNNQPKSNLIRLQHKIIDNQHLHPKTKQTEQTSQTTKTTISQHWQQWPWTKNKRSTKTNSWEWLIDFHFSFFCWQEKFQVYLGPALKYWQHTKIEPVLLQ